ncbi:MAG: CPBP family intramembrane glutamic endopeptidase, partial [Bryobacteraceae bacterium]
MTIERLNSRDKRLLLIVLILSIASVVYTRLSYEAAFPQASIDLRYSREEITRMAAEFLDQRGLDPAGFRNITLFDPDHLARIYLERELGLEEANRLAAEEVSIWRWRARWFRPPEREERVAWLSPTGRVVGLDHVIPEAEAGARLASDEALSIAEAFLAQRTAESHRLIEQTLIERPNRYDYVFTWEHEVFRAGDAPYRRTVTVQGNAVGRYREFLHVPEEWRREYAALRSRNDLYAGIAQFFYVPLILGAIAILIQSLRRRQLIWKPLIAIAAAVGGLMILNEWNAIAFFIDRMPTSSPYHESVLFGLLQAMGAGVGVFFYVILAAAAGEPLYRAQHPGKLSLRGILTLRGVCSKEFFLATLVGYGLAAVHMAFVVAFYLAGRRFGAWSPQDVPYSDLLSTWLPWLYPLTISLLASTSEEFWFRLFGIPFLKRYLKYTWLAVAVSAFVWGFLHANYPQQPPWIRGVEVGIIGLAAGYLFLKFGILATLIWHYTIDAVLIGMFLFQAEDWYFRLSVVVVAGAVLFPLLFSLVQYRRNGGFIHDPEILNASVHREEEEAAPAVAPEQPAPAAADVRRWSVRWLYGAAAIGLASGVFLNPVIFGAFIEV